METAFDKRGKSLENQYFAKRDAELLRQLRESNMSQPEGAEHGSGGEPEGEPVPEADRPKD